jgi:A/G-specific adenine glycosylase
MAISKFDDELPRTRAELEQLPGIGSNTAGAIRAYSFNQPAIYIETNIRTVYIHHFFVAEDAVDDKQLLSLIETTLDGSKPRQWHWALMDYGVLLKQSVGNQGQRSKQYTKPSKFDGSLRQLRAAVLRTVLKSGSLRLDDIARQHPDSRLKAALSGLVHDGLLRQSAGKYHS